MTENNYDKLKDAICELVNIAEDATSREVFEMLDNAGADAIDRLDKLSGYEAIGTIEEFKVLKEKSVAKKPNKAIDSTWGIKKEVNVCPECDCYLTEVHFIACHMVEKNKKVTYCEHCGQAIDWSE